MDVVKKYPWSSVLFTLILCTVLCSSAVMAQAVATDRGGLVPAGVPQGFAIDGDMTANAFFATHHADDDFVFDDERHRANSLSHRDICILSAPDDFSSLGVECEHLTVQRTVENLAVGIGRPAVDPAAAIGALGVFAYVRGVGPFDLTLGEIIGDEPVREWRDCVLALFSLPLLAKPSPSSGANAWISTTGTWAQ